MTITQNSLFSDDCLFVLDNDLHITKFIPNSWATLNHTESELLGTDILKCITESERSTFKQYLLEAQSGKQSAELDTMACDQNSKHAMYRWKIGLQGSVVYVVGRELTTEKIDRSVAHEINNPLTVIQTRAFQLQQLAENNELVPERIKQIADSIHAAAVKISVIVKSLT